MEQRKQTSMALRAAPPIPSKYAPVVGWDDQPFSNDPFEPYAAKKKPPPRPPPPKIKLHTDPRLNHFSRRPTILSNLLSRKPKVTTATEAKENVYADFASPSVDLFTPMPMTANMNTGILIDFSSPPSSPTFTTRSSSDGLSIDSFGSDATSSTHHVAHGGSISQTESGFEDDFDLISSRKASAADPSDPWGSYDPFSPPKQAQKPPLPKKPIFDKTDFIDPLCNGKTIVPKITTHKIPTIIRSKPSRPKPPENSALLQSTLASVLSSNGSLGNRRTFPRQSSFPTSFENEVSSADSSPEREPSPPMPTIPPPPPPLLEEEEDLPTPTWSQIEANSYNPAHFSGGIVNDAIEEIEDPYAIALFDFAAGHEEDLPFTIDTKIKLLRRVNDEWLYGRLRNGMEGMFPASFVEVKVPLEESGEAAKSSQKIEKIAQARVMYDFVPEQASDLALRAGSIVKIVGKVSDEWLLGECHGSQGQFPANYVEYM